jgi:hypothetical protein
MAIPAQKFGNSWNEERMSFTEKFGIGGVGAGHAGSDEGASSDLRPSCPISWASSLLRFFVLAGMRIMGLA